MRRFLTRPSRSEAKLASARREREASGSAGAELKKLMRPKGATLGLFIGILLVAFPIVWAVHRIASFPDVPEDEWYTEAVNELASRGLFSGYDDGTFRPGNFVNRAELAVVLQQLLRQIPNLQEVSGNASGENSSLSFSPLLQIPPGYSSSTQPPPPLPQPSPSPSPPPPPPSNVTVNAAYNTPLERALAFFTNRLSTSNGAIRSTLGNQQASSAVIGVNDEVLSESLGLAFNGLAYAGQRDLFAREFQFFKQYILAPNKLAIWKLNADLTPYNLANATIDDLRIVKGLLRGFERFGIVEYRDTALAMASALKQHATRNNILVSHVTWNQSGQISPADHLILGYADFEAMKMLVPYDAAWNTILANTIAVVKAGQLSNGLFPDRYRFGTAQYEHDELHNIFQSYVIEHLAAAGEMAPAQKLLNFFKNEWEDRGRIFSRYTSGGHPAVSYENSAVYAILARAALLLNEYAFASQLMGKLLSLQITNPISLNYGTFLWSESELVYAFNHLNMLHNIAHFRETPIQPSASPQPIGGSSGSNASPPPPPPPPGVTVPAATPGPAPVITPQNYVVWHMSDIYYGSHDAANFTTMVNDMDTLTWHDAVIAGDISGNGSVENFNGMKNIIQTQSSHPWPNFHFLAGNHEYNCSSTPAAGCLDNYKSLINSNLRYTFDVGNIHFIVMSTDGERHRMSNETMAWLQSEVAANQGKIIIPLTHHMPHVLGNTIPRAQEILDSLGIDIWLFGHAHCKHGNSSCTRHGAYGDYYQQAETAFVDAGHIGNMESRYLIFTEGSNQVRILSRYHKDGGRFQPEFEHTATLRYAFQR